MIHSNLSDLKNMNQEATIINPPRNDDEGPSLFGAAAANTAPKPIIYRDNWAPYGFSATDLNVYIHPPAETDIKEPIKLGTLALLTVSSHRDKFPVSALSRVAPRGFTCGHRTIAGTLAFNTFQRDAFDWLSSGGHSISYRRRMRKSAWGFNLRPDELPPFDIQIMAVNDMGDSAVSTIIGVTLLDSGVTYSLDNITLSETYSYMALDRTPLRPITERRDKPMKRPGPDYNRPFNYDMVPGGGGIGLRRDEYYG